MQSLVALLLCLVASASAASHYEDCESKYGKVTAVKVNGQDKCELKGSPAHSIQIDFEATADVADTELNTQGTARIDGVFQGDLLANIDACSEGGLQCPLKKGTSYSFKTEADTDNIPKDTKKFDVEWAIQNNDGESVVCVMVHCEVV